MDFGPVSALARSPEELRGGMSTGPQLGSTIDAPWLTYWPAGEVWYTIESGFTGAQVDSILKAMDLIESAAAGVVFRPRTSQSYYAKIQPDSVCMSRVGRNNTPLVGDHLVRLAPSCAISPGHVAHELLHTLGLWHEHSRCDRDTYVTIHTSNIIPGKADNFQKRCPHSGYAWDITAGGLDYLSYSESSLMHYAPTYFSSNGQPTITSNRGLSALMGQRDSVSHSDAHTLNQIYQPYIVQGFSISYPSGTPTLSWHPYGKGVTSYDLSLEVVYEEYDDINGTSIIQDYTQEWWINTSSTSAVDNASIYTGSNRCVLWSHTYGSASYGYYYQAIANLPYGVGSQPRRREAYVAPTSC